MMFSTNYLDGIGTAFLRTTRMSESYSFFDFPGTGRDANNFFSTTHFTELVTNKPYR